MSTDILGALGAPPVPVAQTPPWLVVDGDVAPAGLRDAYRALRRREFVSRQGLFARDDGDAADADPATRVLLAVHRDGSLLGGVRLHPADGHGALGWWRGSRLVVRAGERGDAGRGAVGAALVRAACAHALDAGAIRFDAHVQPGHAGFFARLGWERLGDCRVAGAPHLLMHFPLGRFTALTAATKAPLAGLIGGLVAGDRWRGDDGVPVPGSEVVACTDAILPTMVAQDPEWAGWCGLLVTAHDLAAMGARPLGVLDALAAPDAAHAARVLSGVRRGAAAFALPVLGGHTSLGAPAALSLTGLGAAAHPIPAGGGEIGDAVRLTADLAGGWRPGYHGRQWDSTSGRTREALAPMLDLIARARPHAAKDVSMAGTIGTLGMLAEASGAGAEVDVAAIPRPAGAALADWLTCFPGFGMLSTDPPDVPLPPAGEAVTARIGTLVSEPGVRLRWPDGLATTALPGAVSGLGRAR